MRLADFFTLSDDSHMKLVLLGTGGYHPNQLRHTACVMLPEIGLIFDAGTSFFRVPEYLQTDQSADRALPRSPRSHLWADLFLANFIVWKRQFG